MRRLRRRWRCDMVNEPKNHIGYTKWDWHAHHIFYHHGFDPGYLHVRCSSCGKRATAKGWLHGKYVVRCVTCISERNAVSYAQLPQLYYRVSIGTHELWAWNRDHLVEIRNDLLKINHGTKQKITKSRSRFFLRREWLLKRHSFAKAISRFLKYEEA
jgi:hypothetical protein